MFVFLLKSCIILDIKHEKSEQRINDNNNKNKPHSLINLDFCLITQSIYTNVDYAFKIKKVLVEWRGYNYIPVSPSKWP